MSIVPPPREPISGEGGIVGRSWWRFFQQLSKLSIDGAGHISPTLMNAANDAAAAAAGVPVGALYRTGGAVVVRLV